MEKVDITHIGVDVDTPIDIELDEHYCELLIQELTEKYKNRLPGTISIRLVGRLYIS